MANKYGKNGEAVAAFLDEVSATDLAGWRAFFEMKWVRLVWSEAPTRVTTSA